MPDATKQYTTPYIDHGALWAHPNGDDYQGNIYGTAIQIRRNPQKIDGDKFPAWHIIDPQKPDEKPLGALWVSYGKKDGTEYLSGKITIAGVERRVSLWPAKRTKDTSPHWRRRAACVLRQPGKL